MIYRASLALCVAHYDSSLFGQAQLSTDRSVPTDPGLRSLVESRSRKGVASKSGLGGIPEPAFDRTAKLVCLSVTF